MQPDSMVLGVKATQAVTTFIEDNYVWFFPFKIIKKESNEINVYNFEVENDNSYIVQNVIVHNCQSFSNAGKKDQDDPRGQLYLHFVRAINDINPKVIIMENVKGLLSRKYNETPFIDIITGAFKEKYNIIFKVFKCSEISIPQDRERLIILGIRKDLGVIPVFPNIKIEKLHLKNIITFDTEGMMSVPDEIMKDVPEECILTNLENEDLENNIHPYLRKRLVETDVHYNGKFISKYGFSFGKRISPVHCEIIDIRKPSKTIICTYEHAPRLFVPLKNKNGYFLRTLSVNELKQIQGFPIDYIIKGTKKQQIIQIGNAVPPGLIKEILIKVKELLCSN
jgi:DNA (cytosine-5)-methyltransferase 1